MIAIIRISGMVDLNKGIKATLDRLRLRKKYSCVVLEETPEISGMLKKVKQYVAYGKIDNDTFKELLIKRGRLKGDKPIDAKDATDEFISKFMKKEFGKIKPFFRLQPPKGGFKKRSRLLYPKGILGDNKENIKLLIKKML